MEKETALKILRERHAKALFSERTALETLIPELAESEAERIRKDIIEHLKQDIELECTLSKEKGDKWIAWLEKQGKQKSIKNIMNVWKDMRLEVYQQASGNRNEPNYSDDTTKIFSLNDIDEIIEKMSEQKPADKVEPKFREGDWVVSKSGNLWRIDSFDEKHYRVSDINGEYFIPISKQDELQLYISSEAKRGGRDLQQELEKQGEKKPLPPSSTR